MLEMGRKKTRVLIGRGFCKIESGSSFVLSSSFLGCGIGARCFVNAGGALVFFAEFLNKTAGHEVLKFLIGAQAEHFFSTADGVANLEIGEDAFEKIVEAEHLFFCKDIAKLVGDMVRKAT